MELLLRLTGHKIFRRTHDPIWQLELGIASIVGLQLLTSANYLPYNKFIIVGFEVVLMIILAIVTSDGYGTISRLRRSIALALIAIVAVINVFSLIFLTQELITASAASVDVTEILKNGLTIYVTNIFMFALWYWEMDGGGPDHRVAASKQRDFLFPQMIHKQISDGEWMPGFIDYLYLSTTNVTNFASADTMPVSHRAKLLMMSQALVSVAAVVLVAARAIGLLQ